MIVSNSIAKLFVSYAIGHSISSRVLLGIIAENATDQFARIAQAKKENYLKMMITLTESVTFVIHNSRILSLSKTKT
jgi:hypothetical protein